MEEQNDYSQFSLSKSHYKQKVQNIMDKLMLV
jgi:hypothetical protein